MLKKDKIDINNLPIHNSKYDKNSILKNYIKPKTNFCSFVVKNPNSSGKFFLKSPKSLVRYLTSRFVFSFLVKKLYLL